MSTVTPSEKRVKVVALLTQERELVLVDEPLTLETLALLQPFTPLARMFLDGAGLEFRPLGIAVYVDGKRVWSKRCPHVGRTDTYVAGNKSVQAIPFTKAFPEGWDWDDERLAANRAAWELLHNGHSDDAEEVAADLIESAGSLRPVLQPATHPDYEPPADRRYDPDPCERFGDTDSPGLGLPLKPIRQCRRTPEGIEMLLAHDYATL